MSRLRQDLLGVQGHHPLGSRPMSLFDADAPPRDDRCRVLIITRPWMCGWWFVMVQDYDTSMFGFTRMTFRRSRLAAIKQARRWVEGLMRRTR